MMKAFLQKMGVSIFMGFVLPVVMFAVASGYFKQIPVREAPVLDRKELPGVSYMLPVLMEGEVQELDLEEYILGVVLGEMPMSFADEALKAQAVVARTYTMRAFLQGSKHEQAAVCTNSGCCQAYLSPQDYLSMGGTAEKLERLRKLVRDTQGQVVTYQQELIMATYFSCSGGSTEDAVAVWGQDIPYLQATVSPGEENAGPYSDSVTFTRRELEDRLSVTLTGAPDGWIRSVTHTDGGGVDTLVMGDKTFTGTELRKLLGLRSTAISWTYGDNCLILETKGFGHRVGMSQYGADAMAVTGAKYPQILAYYYAGTELDTLPGSLTKLGS